MRPSTRCSDQSVDDPTALPIQTVFARACDPESTPLPDALRDAIVAELDRGCADDRGSRVPLADLGPSVAAWAAT